MDENQSDYAVTNNVDAAPEAEKTLTQSQVNAIVQREKAKAAEIARKQAEDSYRQERETLQTTNAVSHQPNMSAAPGVDENALYQKFLERFNDEIQKNSQHQHMNDIANNYLSKMEKGPELYEDFKDVTKDFDPAAFPQLTYLLANVDNAADVLYDLRKNPQKLVTIDGLARTAPRMAQTELKKLSDSITQNKQAKAEADSQHVPSPLDRLQPSRVSGSNGKMTISDLRNQPWLRG